MQQPSSSRGRCEHPEILIDMLTHERRCTSCGKLVAEGGRRSMRTLFEVRGMTWLVALVGCATLVYFAYELAALVLHH
jgi:hypothetical protein